VFLEQNFVQHSLFFLAKPKSAAPLAGLDEFHLAEQGTDDQDRARRRSHR
jgi:hypothetical protein